MSSNINDTFSTTGSGPAPNTSGPHKNDMLNRADPRIDSDKDNSRTLGGNTNTGSHIPEGTHGTGAAGTIGSGLTGSHGTQGTYGSGLTGATGTQGTQGTHISGLTGGTGATGTRGTHGHDSCLTSGTHEGGFTSGTHESARGPHGSRATNVADPHIDSDRDHRAAHAGEYSTTTGSRVTGATAGTLGGSTHTGPAPNTAGPHKSDLLNKLDPRVDSNLDGSKTVGGDKTYTQS